VFPTNSPEILVLASVDTGIQFINQLIKFNYITTSLIEEFFYNNFDSFFEQTLKEKFNTISYIVSNMNMWVEKNKIYLTVVEGVQVRKKEISKNGKQLYALFVAYQGIQYCLENTTNLKNNGYLTVFELKKV
jgi:hypothetical protein